MTDEGLPESDLMDSMVGSRHVMITQETEIGEAVLGFETRNRYRIHDGAGGELGFAAEEAGGVGKAISRNMLGANRPCRLHIYDAAGQKVAEANKPFRFFFPSMDLLEGGRLIGRAERKFKIIGRRFVVEDSAGREVFEIIGRALKIWTFNVMRGGREVARISKEWSGLMKEAFTDADNFGVEFIDEGLSADERKLLVMATFLIDFACFENNNNR